MKINLFRRIVTAAMITICLIISVTMTAVFAEANIDVSETIKTLKYSQLINDGSKNSVGDGKTPESIDPRVKSSVNIYLGMWSDSFYQTGNTMLSPYSNTSDTSVTYDLSDLEVSQVRILAETHSADKLRSILRLYAQKDGERTELNYNVTELFEDRYAVYVYEVIADIPAGSDTFIISGKESVARLSAINAVEFYEETDIASLYELDEDLQLLWGLGAVDGSKLSEQRLNSEMSRGEFAVALCTLMGKNSDFYKQYVSNNYIDLNSDTAYAGCMDYLTSLGYMSTERDGSFRPDKAIEYNEAVKAALYVLGYGELAEDASVFNMSEARGLVRGLDRTSGTLSVREACRVLYNMLNSRQLVRKGDAYRYNENTYMENVLSIYDDIGQISQTKYGALSSVDSMEDDEISINGVKYKIGTNNYNGQLLTNDRLESLLGYNIKFYYSADKNGNSRKIISYKIDSNNTKPIILDYESITVNECNDKSLAYWDENDKKKSAKLAINKYIVNGERKESFSVSDIYTAYHDSIALFDGDNDGLYETVFIYDFEKIIVDRVLNDNLIVAKNSSSVFDLNENLYDNVNYIIDGRAGSADDLQKNQILSIAISQNKQFCTIFISTNVINGDINSFDQNKREIKINNKAYKIDNTYFRELQSGGFFDVNLGDTGTFYIDHKGRIVFYVKGNSSEEFGYLIGLQTDGGGFNERVIARLINTEAKERTFHMSSKFSVRYGEASQRCKRFSDMMPIVSQYMNEWTKSEVTGVIKYKINSSDEITEVIFPTRNANSKFFSLSYKDDSAVIYGNIAAKSYSFANAKVFIVPDDLTRIDQFSNSMSFIGGNNSTRSVELYDANEMNDAKVIVCYINNVYQNLYTNGSHAAMVSEVFSVLDDDGNQRLEVKMLQGGVEKNYTLAEELKLSGACLSVTPSTSSVREGMVVKFRVNNENEICKLQIAYDADNDKKENDVTNAEWSSFTANVVRSDGKYLLTDSATWPLVSLSSAKIAVYDAKEKIKVRTGTVADIVPGDKVMSFNNYGSCRNLFIIK